MRKWILLLGGLLVLLPLAAMAQTDEAPTLAPGLRFRHNTARFLRLGMLPHARSTAVRTSLATALAACVQGVAGTRLRRFLAGLSADELEYLAGYGLFGYRVNGWLMPYARGDFRQAVHTSGASFVYHSDLVRTTGGLRLDLGSNVIFKGEYTHIVELGPVPPFPNDVLTSSLVARW